MPIMRYRLTTFDNQFDPLNQPVKWLLEDIRLGYNSAGYLARLARVSDNLTDEENECEMELAIDTIIRNDFLNIYKKVIYEDRKPITVPEKIA